MHPSPNILRELLLSDVRQSTNWLKERSLGGNFRLWNRSFWSRKGRSPLITCTNYSYFTEIIQKILSITKKIKKVTRNFGSTKFVFRPPNTVPSLRPWATTSKKFTWKSYAFSASPMVPHTAKTYYHSVERPNAPANTFVIALAEFMKQQRGVSS